jgi:hypothetical protein
MPSVSSRASNAALTVYEMWLAGTLLQALQTHVIPADAQYCCGRKLLLSAAALESCTATATALAHVHSLGLHACWCAGG